MLFTSIPVLTVECVCCLGQNKVQEVLVGNIHAVEAVHGTQNGACIVLEESAVAMIDGTPRASSRASMSSKVTKKSTWNPCL